MTTSLNLLAIFAITASLTASEVGPVMAGSLDASMADALSGQFVADGDLTTLPAVAPAEGSAPPSYNHKEELPDYAEVLNIAHKPAAPAALYAHLTGVWDHVMGSRFGVDSHVSEGDTSIATAALMLNLNPSPPTVGVVPLLISATGVHASSSYRVVARSTFVSGTASFGELIITGSLLGDTTLTYSGIPPANYLLFSNAEISITLNEQVATTVTCVVGEECTVIQDGIHVEAVHVALTKADIFGRIVSGDFFLGEVQAGNSERILRRGRGSTGAPTFQ
jgi:hypothetical protein